MTSLTAAGPGTTAKATRENFEDLTPVGCGHAHGRADRGGGEWLRKPGEHIRGRPPGEARRQLDGQGVDGGAGGFQRHGG